MNEHDIYKIEFDEERRILHVAYRRRIHPATEKQLDKVFAYFHGLLDQYTKTGRIYLIIDMTNLIIEPELKAFYMAHAREVIDKYIMPQGVARYGFQITRITVRSGYQQYSYESPNIFNSREEAYQYIYSLIEKNEEMSGNPPVTAMTEDSASC